MASYVYIELDTTAPEIEIFTPAYTTTDLVTTIRIEANEDVSSFQEIYVIDSNGMRHDYTFQFERSNVLIGRISFFNFPFGDTTIYARLKDDVDNVSNLTSKTFVIKETLTLLVLEIGDCEQQVDTAIPVVRDTHITAYSRNVYVGDRATASRMLDIIARIDISDCEKEVRSNDI